MCSMVFWAAVQTLMLPNTLLECTSLCVEVLINFYCYLFFGQSFKSGSCAALLWCREYRQNIVEQAVLINPVLGQDPCVHVCMVSGHDFCMIVDCQRQDCFLLFIDFAELVNFGVIEEKDSLKCRKRSTKKINHDHARVNKWLWPDVPSRSEVAQHFGDAF